MADEASTTQTTEYVVLEQREATSVEEAAERQANIFYVEGARIVARSSRAAIRAYITQNGIDAGGTFYAVPVRSWRPEKPKVETQTRLTF